MAAIVKPIEAKAIHLIQSGQVIVDLCSVVKELVENSLDAESTSIEVRFKNNGLEEIEVQDNGTGIAPANYEAIALKHYTSKLATYDDLTSLSTFGFRGEALSSLCALSNFTVITAQAQDAPKGCRLEFEASGKLSSTSIVACQKGTTISVSDLFQNLPVRRKELAKNIKREYSKVLGLLHAYACISTNVKFTVKNIPEKGKSVTAFTTKANTTTRENIANIYGAKTLSALVPLDLVLDLDSTIISRDLPDARSMRVTVKGHISKPVFGEGRQTPDRQMFFVNGRPCGLPQIAKAINEVYRSFNSSQSPFVLADFQMDTNAYDVNVSPDKRSILLHNAAVLTDILKTELTAKFENQEQTVPQAKLGAPKLPAFRQLTVSRSDSVHPQTDNPSEASRSGIVPPLESGPSNMSSSEHRPFGLLQDHFRDIVSTREPSNDVDDYHDYDDEKSKHLRERRAAKIAKRIGEKAEGLDNVQQTQDEDSGESVVPEETVTNQDIHVRDFNARMGEQQAVRLLEKEQHSPLMAEPEIIIAQNSQIRPDHGLVQTAFDRMRPKRMQPETATITIGDKTVTRVTDLQPGDSDDSHHGVTHIRSTPSNKNQAAHQFSQRIGRFSALGTLVRNDLERVDVDQEDESSLIGSDEREEAASEQLPFNASKHEPEADQDAYDDEIELDSRAQSKDDMSIEEKRQEEARVADLISMAEKTASKAEKEQRKRLAQAMKGGQSRDSMAGLQLTLDVSVNQINEQIEVMQRARKRSYRDFLNDLDEIDLAASNEEERLSLTVAKSDFADMHIVGQFNLGFILAVRNGRNDGDEKGSSLSNRDELFIIDQHASDEKFNFERLQAETMVGSQRMVRPATLDLTAVEEEILIDNHEALEKNGFVVDIDTSGDRAVGQRCQLVSLPVSKELAFTTKDLDELIHLLSETPMLSDSSFVPRPTKVRKMFAMRACRSSIMIGKTLSKKQMADVLQHMGIIERPWNCPHGRPTMRHLASLDSLDSILWKEGEGVFTGSAFVSKSAASDVWMSYTAS